MLQLMPYDIYPCTHYSFTEDIHDHTHDCGAMVSLKEVETPSQLLNASIKEAHLKWYNEIREIGLSTKKKECPHLLRCGGTGCVPAG